MLITFIISLLVTEIFTSSEERNKKQLSMDINYLFVKEKIPSWNKSMKLDNIKKCIPELISEVTLSNKETKGFVILLLFIIKLRKEIFFQTNYFFKNILFINKSIIKVCYEYLNDKLGKEIINRTFNYLLYPIYNKNFLFENNYFILDNHKYTNCLNINENIIKFNKFIYGYLDFHQNKIHSDLNYYFFNRGWCFHGRKKKYEKIEYSIFKSIIYKKKFKDFFNFFSDFKLVIKFVIRNNNRKYFLKKLHNTLCLILLAYKTTNQILFRNRTELFKNKFIPKYKLIIIEKMLLDFYIYLSLTLSCAKVNENILIYLLLKAFLLYSKIKNESFSSLKLDIKIDQLFKIKSIIKIVKVQFLKKDGLRMRQCFYAITNIDENKLKQF